MTSASDHLRNRSTEIDLGYTTPCWSWTGSTDPDGYPTAWADGTPCKSLRVLYGALVGPIPDGHVMDHLCHTASTCTLGRDCPHRRCINPYHAEPVTRAENTRRGHFPRGPRPEQERATCPQGHQRSRRPAGNMACRVCDADRARARRADR